MAATNARSGFGALLKRGDGGSPEVFTTISEVANIGAVETSLDTVEATHMESPSAHKEYIPTLLDAKEISVELNYLPGDTTQNNLRSDLLNRTLRNFQCTIPGSAKVISFAAFVTNLGPMIPVDGKMTQTLNLRPNGVITIA